MDHPTIVEAAYFYGAQMLKNGIPPPQLSKSSVISDNLRKVGNEQFKTGDFMLALSLYNRSLCLAPPGSESIPLTYGNRSAVYCQMGKHALAIENIKLARESGFPAEKMAQLDDREERCKDLMEKFGPDNSFNVRTFFKLSHPPNKKIPFIADCLELRKCEKYGRGIYTTKDLKTGDIVAIETPAFSWVDHRMPVQTCIVCSKINNGSLIPCVYCTTVMYCSKDCQQKEAPLHHNNEFGKHYIGHFKKSLSMQLEAFEVAGGVDEALELLKDFEGKTIFDFDFSSPDDPNYNKNLLIALNGLWKSVGSQEMMEIKPDQLLNIPPINQKPRTAQQQKLLLKFIISQFQICFSNLAPFRGASHGIFLLRSLLNHSCIPNVGFAVFDTEMISMASRPIKAGEQLFMAYFANAAVHPRQERHRILQIFQFKCDCQACTNDWPQLMQMKDRSFIEPGPVTLNPAEAIEQFKKNCKYIDKNADKLPCYEVHRYMYHNYLLTNSIAGNKII